jgi:hypothetical protein
MKERTTFIKDIKFEIFLTALTVISEVRTN